MIVTRATVLLLAVFAVMAFAVKGPRGGSDDPLENLEQSPRWALGQATLVDGGERSLAGGLEYAVHPSVCAMRFVDGASCAEVQSAIEAALDIWASGHPALSFRDVGASIPPAYPRARFGARAQGAEIDFFGARAETFPLFASPAVTGYTIFYERAGAAFRLTNGQAARAAGRIESADVRFNASLCFYIDVAFARPECVHFPSLVLHEVGHALGIGHPEEQIVQNLDSDDIPSNEIRIDCMDPRRGLRASRRYDGAAVMIGRDVQGPGRWQRGLSWDDVAARDALYPNCGIERLVRFGGAWGAFAASGERARALVTGAASADVAENAALLACARDGGANCRLVTRFDGCFAYAEGRRGGAGHARSPRSDHARVDAVIACAEAGGEDCRVAVQGCAFE